MKMITSWLKAFFAKHPGDEHQDPHINVIAQNSSTDQKKTRNNQAFYENFYSLIAAGARLHLIEAMFNLNLFALFEEKAIVSEHEIIEKLGLMPIRAQKWLHLLTDEHFLIKTHLDNQPAYQLPEEFIELIKGYGWWAMKFFFESWKVAADENLTEVLRYGKVKTSVSWPPKTDSEAEWLEYWMKSTADQPLYSVLSRINFNKVTSFLDVGGGDGTMACAFVTKHPHLNAAVYNLPKSAELARKNIAAKNLSDKVQVIEGDFINDDAFPPGFDLILFTRVFFDWNETVNRKLLKMAYQALPENGLVSICEFYKEDNYDMCLASEYRYLFHDDFASHVMKSAAEYKQMLKEVGFTLLEPEKQEKLPPSFCSVLLAKK